MRRYGAAIIAAFSLVLTAAAQEATDMRLSASGFKVRFATTPEQTALLKRVPPRTLLSRTRDGRHFYLYVDPDGCKCALLGNEDAMKNYRAMLAMPREVPVTNRGEAATGEMIREMNDDIGTNDMLDGPF